MACPADGVLLGAGHLLLWATWTACGSTCLPWPSGPSGVVWPLEAETTAVCHLTPKAQSSLLFPLGTKGKQADGKKVSPLQWNSASSLSCLRAGINEQLPGRGVEGGPVNVQQGASGKLCSSQPGVPFWAGGERLFMGSEEGMEYKALAHKTEEERVDLEFSLKNRGLRVI